MDSASEIEWKVGNGLVPYAEALSFMEGRAEGVRAGTARECIWLVEHPSLFTAGTSADPAELFNPFGFPVYDAGRGGRYTYHGPGQRVVYLTLDLQERGRDIRRFVHSVEGWIISALSEIGISAHRAPGRIGIWVGSGAEEAKIASIGIRVKRWVTLHGFSINLDPDLAHFSGIVPCGISEFGVTSIARLGRTISMHDLDGAIRNTFPLFLNSLSVEDKVS